MYFFVIVAFIFLAMHVLVGGWFYFLFPSLGAKFSLFFFPVFGILFISLAMTYTRTHYGTLESILYYSGYIWAGLIFLFSALVFLFFCLQALCSLFHLSAKPILGYISIVILAGAAIWSIYGGFKAPTMRFIDITLPNAPKMTLALISDTHLGEGVSLPRFQKALAQIQSQQPDALLILGDLFEYGANAAAYAQALREIRTPLGSFGVLGNHEYYVGYQNSVQFYQQAGITLLQNEFISLPNGMELIGINDSKTTGMTASQLDQLLSQTNANTPRILLSHQPALTATVAEHQVPLMLSGHTHAGQIWPFNYAVKWVYPYLYGLYSIGDHSQLYVTSGMFYWGMPMRFLAPAEIPILRINHDDK